MRIIFEFAGGPLDGKAVVGQLGRQDEADRYYVLTHHGKIGQRFRIASDYAVEILAREQLKSDSPHHFQQHGYRVSERLEYDDEVLIRAEYVEPAAEDRLAERSAGTPATDPDERIRRRVDEIVADCQRSWTAAYSHYWPAEGLWGTGQWGTGQWGTTERGTGGSGGGPTRLAHLTLHLGHVMLARNFSVFLDARQPGYPLQPIDVLGLAPVQDWFLACRCLTLDQPASLPRLSAAIEQLGRFWLHSGLTIGAGQSHLAQVAAHCQQGYGLVAAMHWTGAGQNSSSLVEFWSKPGESPLDREVVDRDRVRLSWLRPVVLGQVQSLGTAYLLAACFPLRRSADEDPDGRS